MASLEQVIDGLIRYIKRELIPILPGYAKVIGGAVLLRNSSRIAETGGKLAQADLAKTLGIVSDNGSVDIDVWAQNLKEAIRDFGDGKLAIQLPMLQPLYFSEQDVETLKRYIRGEL